MGEYLKVSRRERLDDKQDFVLCDHFMLFWRIIHFKAKILELIVQMYRIFRRDPISSARTSHFAKAIIVALTVFNILALLFVLPLQTMSYVKTMSHLQKHTSEQAPDDDNHHDHDGGEHHDDVAPSPDDFATHQHSPEEAPHSHAKDFFGVFSNVFAFASPSQETFLIEQSYPDVPLFNVLSMQSQFSARSLLRPPIYA